MKVKIIILSMLIGNMLFANDNDEELKTLLTNYIVNIIAYSENPEDIGVQHNLYNVFSTIDINHDNDFISYKKESTLRNYLIVIGRNFEKGVSFKIEDLEILKCTNTRYGKKYRYATIKKTIRIDGKLYVNRYLILIDVTNPNYKINALYIITSQVEEEYVSECIDEKRIIDLDLQLKLVKSKLDEADNFYSEGNYKKAYNLYGDAFKIDSESVRATQGIRDCEKLLEKRDYEVEIENLIRETRFDAALSELRSAENNKVFFDSEWIKMVKIRCKRGNIKKERDYLEYLGKDYCNKGFYLKAKDVYVRLLKDNPNFPDYIIALEECKKKDVNYATNEIEKAYKIARNRLLKEEDIVKVFLVYYKYEDTNLLEGKHYDFMTRALIRKKSRLRRELNLSNYLAKKLLGKYYYITQKKGIDNAELENLIPSKIRNSYAY